jgi:hypothetical protein
LIDVGLPYIPHVRRNPISRIFAGFFSLWLATCLAEPVQLHTCAMHGGLAIETNAASAHASQAHHMAMHGSSQSDRGQDSDSQSRQCSCLGDCNAGSGPVGLPAVSVSLAATTRGNSPAPFDYSSPIVSAANHLLPFANGPPSNSLRA